MAQVLPLAVIFFALRRHEENPPEVGWLQILSTVIIALGAVAAMTMLVTIGQEWLPTLVDGGRFTSTAKTALAILLGLPVIALVVLARRKELSTLDLWLMVVMFGWLCTITLGAFVSGGRYDISWYVGRVFDWLTSLLVLLVLLSQTILLYSRNFRAAEIERRQRERRIKEMEAVLIHLSRVSELGQNVSSLIHEVNQPLTAISNYMAAGIQMVAAPNPERLRHVMERSAAQARRATEIIRHLRDFIARRDSERNVVNIPDMLQKAVDLAMVGTRAEATSIKVRCEAEASAAFCDGVQIEQVVFSLVRNAIEAMADSDRRNLNIDAKANPDSMIEVTVADNGPGLSRDIREKLFEPFVTTKPGGLGVGLSICRVIIEAHGGRLQTEDNPGGGTIFSFTLPQAMPG